MRTFGTEIDLVIDNELRKGMNQYNMILYQNGNKLDIYIKKMTIHFLTAAVPYGNVTKYYFELETDYMDFLEQDEVKVEIEKNGVSVEVSTFYIKSFKKGEAISTYVAYTSLVEPEKIRLYKIDEERPWRVDWNTGAKTIREILDTFLTPIGMSMSEYPTYTGTFVSYYADWENMSLAQLISACGILEGCNYVLIGNVFHPIRPSTSSSFKSYKISETVYKDNFYQQRSDAKCGIMDIGYKRWAYEDSTSEDPMLGFQVSFTSMLCHWERTSRGTGKFRTDFPLIPAEHSKKLFDHFADKLSCYFGFDMNVYSVSYLGDALLEPGDRVCFYSNDKSAFFYPSELIWEWDGGLKCTAKSEAVQKSGTSDATVSLQELANTLYTLSTTLQNVRYNSVTTKTLEADSATIGLLKVEQADVKYATIQSLTATEAKITTLDSTTIKTDELYAKVAELDYIKSDHADIANLKSTMITADNLRTEIAKIGYLTADEADIRYLTVSTANATFLHADMSDMDIAKIQTLFATAGIVSDMTIKDGHITGELSGIKVSANDISAGRLDAATIEVVNLNAANITVGTINGQQIASGAIDLTKLGSDVTNKLADTEEDVAKAVEDAKNAIKTANGISVGGRNRIRNSAVLGGFKGEPNIGSKATWNNQILTRNNGNNEINYGIYHIPNIVAKSGETWTLSMDIEDIAGWLNFGFASVGRYTYDLGENSTKQGVQTNGRVSLTYTFNQDVNFQIYISMVLAGSSAKLSNVKLELGNKATDWTPAPEDVYSSIDTASIKNWCYNGNLAWMNGAKIYANTIVSDAIATDAITAVKIKAGAITADKLAANSVTAGKIAANAVTAGTIEAGSITTDKLSAKAITSEKIATDAVTADKILAKSITATKIASGTITSDEIAAGTIKASNINVTDLVGNSAFINSLKSNTVIVGLQNDINGISVGGRNLIRNSHSQPVTYTYPSSSLSDKMSSRTPILLNGDTYTLSFWAKSTVAGDRIVTHFYNPSNNTGLKGSQGQIENRSDGYCEFTLSTTLTKYWVTYNIPKGGNTFKSFIVPRMYAGSGRGTVTIQWEKLEEGNKATDWTPAPEDVDSLISAAQSTANSANSLASTANGTANSALTGLNNLEIGGNNLLRNSADLTKWNKETGVTVTKQNDGYFCIRQPDTSKPERWGIYQDIAVQQNTDYTMAVDGRTNVCFSIGLGTTYVWGGTVVSNEKTTKRYVYKFNTGSNTCLRVYLHDQGNAGVYLKCPKLEKGNKATDWTMAIEDWCYNNDITYINGGKIYTGTVTADKIAANSITADKLSVDAITSRNYVKDVAGTKISLADGSYDSKYTKIDAEGKISCSNIDITGEESNINICYSKTITDSVGRTGLHTYSLFMDPHIISLVDSNAYTTDTIDISTDGINIQGINVIENQHQTFPIIHNVADVRTSSGASLNTVNSNLNKCIKSGQSAGLSCIELSSSTPYIDFHYGQSTADYTSRIIESALGQLTFDALIKSKNQFGDIANIPNCGNNRMTFHWNGQYVEIYVDATHLGHLVIN